MFFRRSLSSSRSPVHPRRSRRFRSNRSKTPSTSDGERTWPELREYASFNNLFVNNVSTARAANKTVDDILRDWTIPPGYEKYLPIDAARLKNNVALTMKELDDEARVYELTRRATVGDSYIGSRTATDSPPPPDGGP